MLSKITFEHLSYVFLRIFYEFPASSHIFEEGSEHFFFRFLLLLLVCSCVYVHRGLDITVPYPLLYILDINPTVNKYADTRSAKAVKSQTMIKQRTFSDYLLKSVSEIIRTIKQSYQAAGDGQEVWLLSPCSMASTIAETLNAELLRVLVTPDLPEETENATVMRK